MLTILYGENDYEISAIKQKIVNDYLQQSGSDFGLEMFDSEVEPNHLWQAINSQPFLITTKLVIVKNPSKNTDLANFLAEKLYDIPDTTHLVITENSLDKRTGYYKKINKNKHATELKTKQSPEMLDWLMTYAKLKGLKLTKTQAQQIIQRAGENQWRLSSEIDKLAPLGEVTSEQIDDLVEQDPTDTVFNLLDNLALGKLEKSQNLYDNLRKQQIEANVILSMLVWQVQNIFLLAVAENRSDKEVAKDAGMNPFVVSKTRPLAHKLGKKKVAQAVTMLADYEQAIKTGKLEADQGVRLAISKLAGLFS